MDKRMRYRTKLQTSKDGRLESSVPKRLQIKVCERCEKMPPPVATVPEVVISTVTDRCNLMCPTCNYWRSPAGSEPELSLAEHQRLIELLSRNGIRRAVLTGGEPTLRGDWKELLSLWSDNVPDVLLLTNGTLWDDEAIDLLSARKNVRVVISWDGWDPKSMDISVGRKGMHGVIWAGIGRLCENRDMEGRVGINITITPKNMYNLSKIVKKLVEHGMDFFHFHLVYSPGRTYRFTMEQCFHLPELVGDAIRELNSCGVNDIINHVPYAFVQSSRCFIPFSHSTIGPRGEVFGCIPAKGGFQDVASNALGNLRTKPFDEIWHSPEYQVFRADALEGRHENCIACLACHAARNFSAEPCRSCDERPTFAARTPEFY